MIFVVCSFALNEICLFLICAQRDKPLRLTFQDLPDFLVVSTFKPNAKENPYLDSFLVRGGGSVVASGFYIGLSYEIISHILLIECAF